LKIYLARHAQSQWQLSPSDDWDTSLSVLGRIQAQRLGNWLAQHELVDANTRVEVSSLVASPLKRAQETAECLAIALELRVETLEKLREATFHVAEHLPSYADPKVSARAAALSNIYTMFKREVQLAFHDLVDRAELAGGPVMAVTHGGVMKTMLRIIVSQDAFCCRIYNTGIATIEWRRGRWHLVHWNLCDHLPAHHRTF
jgi:probable phosphoglycerate mutase